MNSLTESSLQMTLQSGTQRQPTFKFATVGSVFTDGVSLIFDGEASESSKHYKVNTSVEFKAGDRVKICQDSGTYVVEYVVGNPKSSNLNIETDRLVSGSYSLTLNYYKLEPNRTGMSIGSQDYPLARAYIGNLYIPDTYSPSNVGRLYAADGSLYWNGSKII